MLLASLSYFEPEDGGSTSTRLHRIIFQITSSTNGRPHIEVPLSSSPDIMIMRFGRLHIAIEMFCPQVTAHIPARRLYVNSWLQQEGQQWWLFLALNPGARAHYLAAWVFANPHFSASPAHTATTTTKPLHQLLREHLVWTICLNRHQEVRSVLNHRYCFPKKHKPNKGRNSLAASVFLLDQCSCISMLWNTSAIHFEAV